MPVQTASELPVDLGKLQAIQTQLQQGFRSGRLRTMDARLRVLERLESLVQENQSRLCKALQDDLGRPTDDSIIAELSVIIEEAQNTRKNLKRWMKPQNKWMPLVLFPSAGRVVAQPYGVTLIIGPWNYPFQLLLAPLVSALAAGNCALLKPSEHTPNCSQLMSELIPKYLPSDIVQIVEGGVELSQQLLQMKWDHIFFTGSTQVGRIVAQAAARHLTPVVLELGGKSPCVLDTEVDLEVTVRRILWGKLLNSGQTCVAPDYIFVPRGKTEDLVRQIQKTLDEFFPNGFVRSETYCSIVNRDHFHRLSKLTESHQHQLRIGGKLNQSQNLIEPSVYVLDEENLASAPIMKEEIFGPLIPIIPYDRPQQVVDYINANEHPLALYVFSANQDFVRKIEQETRSGSFVVNDTVIQLATSQLPFGGVGASGIGAYHGRTGFDAFSHRRAVLSRPFWLDLPIRYRPYAAWKRWILGLLLGYRKTLN